MKVLHVSNPGRVASLIARHFEGSVVYLSTPFWDPFQLGNDPTVKYVGGDLLGAVLRDARDFDVIHVHSLDWMLPKIREQYPEKTMIMHHHGQNLREDPAEASKRSELVDKILFCTPDLKQYLPARAEYLPNLIDETLFKPASVAGLGTVFPHCYERHNPYIPQVLARFPDCFIFKRLNNPLPYWQIPGFLARFDTLISWKPEVDYEHSKFAVLTLTDLEMLALGHRVYYWHTGEIVTEFPFTHRTDYVISLMRRYYKEAKEAMQ